MDERASSLDSRLILALDFPERDPSYLLTELEDLLVGVKVGFPLALRIGWDGIEEMVSEHPDYYWIADFKLADIPDVVESVLTRFMEMGLDAAIIHLFTGHRRYQLDLDLIGVAGMSHPQARLIRANFVKLLEEAELLEINGIVVGATRPEMIREAKERLPDKLIFSPGVGFQGAQPGSALEAGASFEIVGRSILRSPDPVKAAERIVEAQREVTHG